MNDDERVVKHLEFIQGTISRLGRNTILVKGMTVLVAGALLVIRLKPDQPLLILTLLVPIVGFWILDAYFLWQERLFRAEYDRVRQQDGTDFVMNPMQHKHKPEHSWRSTFSSTTLRIFYGMEILFVLVLVGYLCIAGNPTSGSCCLDIFLNMLSKITQ